MYKITLRKELNPTVTMMEIEAPLVAKKAEPGQFIILRVNEDGERIPLTIAGYDREKGTVRIIFQIVGATTTLLNAKKEGEYIQDFVGPLGVATHIEGLKRVCIVGGGVGCAIALPIGPLIMMKFVVAAVKPTGIPCTVSMNPIMIDGTGMCGGCRLTLHRDGERITKFACVDGPDFNGYEVDFDEAMSRGAMYRDFERHALEETCNLLNKEVK